MSTSRLQNINRLAEGWVRDEVAQTIVLLAARRGRIVLHRAFGRLSSSAESPPTPLNALFNTASIGKVITATAVMVLVEEGRVGLNRPVAAYFPEFRGEGKDAVLVRHLLTHTSGLRDEEVDRYARDQDGRVPIPPAPEGMHPITNEYLVVRYGAPLWKRPGEEMSYCSIGYELLGELVRRASGLPLDRFASQRIFRPLGMVDTSYCEVDLPQDRRTLVPSYILEEAESEKRARLTERLCWGSASTVSTALDQAVFCQMFLNRGEYGDARILSPASVAAMTRNQIPGLRAQFYHEEFPEASYGLGWSIHGTKTGRCGGLYSPEAYEHWGAGGTYVWVDPTHDLIGVYFTAGTKDRADDGLAGRMAKSFRNDLFTDALTAAIMEV